MTNAQRAELFRVAQARARGVPQQAANPYQSQPQAAAQRSAVAQRPGTVAVRTPVGYVAARSPRSYMQPRVAMNQPVAGGYGAASGAAVGVGAAVAAPIAPLNAGSLPGWSNAPYAGGGIPSATTLPGTPVGAPAGAPMGPPVGGPGGAPLAGPVDDGGGYAGGGAGCADGGCNLASVPHCWEKRLWGPHYHWVWNSTGDMPQHMPYFPHSHGYYYFRPYNVVHVLQQQEMATRWAGDARDPYDVRMFEKIYQQHEAEPVDAVPSQDEINNYAPPLPR